MMTAKLHGLVAVFTVSMHRSTVAAALACAVGLTAGAPAVAQAACPVPLPGDCDCDGIADAVDNCPSDANVDQSDGDGDGRGDACDLCATAAGAAEDACLGAGGWELASGNTVPRHESGVVASGGIIYLIGGQQADAGKSVEIYDPATDTWAAGPSLPSARHHIQPVAVKGRIYVIGGLTPVAGVDLGQVLVLDTDDLAAGWQSGASMPTPRAGMGCAAHAGTIYCAGGESSTAGGQAVDVLEAYDTTADSWQTLAPMPRNRHQFAAQVIDGKLYAVAGREFGIQGPLAFTDVYDIASGAWSQAAPIPTPRSGFASAVLEGRLLVIGGQGPGVPDGTFVAVDEYDPARDAWRSLADLPTARHGFGAATSNAADGVRDRVYAISGGPTQGFSMSTAHEVLTYEVCSFDADCDDSLACTADACSAGVCSHTVDHAACSDGEFCNGTEVCALALGCRPAAATGCDDGIDCTDDVCDEVLDACAHSALDTLCDDSEHCNGAETCDPAAGCLPGAAVICDDGVDCTSDACDEVADACSIATYDAFCDDGVLCNGAETCDPAAGCLAGAPTDCDDGVDCTVDSCDGGSDSCVHVAVDGLCDDEQHCNGLESCDAATGCEGGTTVDCDDGIGCTVDSCDEAADACDNDAFHGPCADGLYCNGIELCDAAIGCLPGAPVDCAHLDDQCTLGECDELSTGCAAAPINEGVACDDGSTCTLLDTCQGGVCTSFEVNPFVRARIGARVKPGPVNDSFSLKTDFATADMPEMPTLTGMALTITGADRTEIYRGLMPAETITAVGTGTKFVFRSRGAFTEAPGMIKATVRIKEAAGTVRFNAKMRDHEISDAVNQPSLTLELKFGDDLGAGCLTALQLQCSGSSRLKCKTL